MNRCVISNYEPKCLGTHPGNGFGRLKSADTVSKIIKQRGKLHNIRRFCGRRKGYTILRESVAGNLHKMTFYVINFVVSC